MDERKLWPVLSAYLAISMSRLLFFVSFPLRNHYCVNLLLLIDVYTMFCELVKDCYSSLSMFCALLTTSSMKCLPLKRPPGLSLSFWLYHFVSHFLL